MVPRSLLPSLAILLACSFATPALAHTDGAGDREVTLIYTGFTGGLSSNSINFAEIYPLFEPGTHRSFQVGSFVNDNVFAHGDTFLYTDQGPLTLGDFQAFFAEGPVEVRPEGEMAVVATDYAYVLTPAAHPVSWPVDWLLDTYKTTQRFPDARRATVQRYSVVNRAGLKLSGMSLSGRMPSAEALERPSSWEMMPAGVVRLQRGEERVPVLAICRPFGDGLRRAGLLKQLRAEHTGHALTVDVGNLLDPGFSELSLRQREFTMLQLSHLGYDALVPAETELSLPPNDWARLAKAVPLVAANLKPQQATQAELPPYLIREIAGLKVALIGLVDDRVLIRQGLCGPQAAWKATDPLAAANAAVTALAAEKPDAIFVLTNIRDERMQDLRLMVGPTAVLADFGGLPGEVFTESIQLTGAARLRSMNPYLVAHSSKNRVGLLKAFFADREGARPELKRMEGQAHLVTDRLPSDETWRHQLNLTVDRYQKERRQLLLPDLRELMAVRPTIKLAENALPLLDERLWTRMVANMMRRATASEVAIARTLPMKNRTLGPVSQLTLEGWLEAGDRLVQLTIPGKSLKELAVRNKTSGLLTFAGYDPDQQKVLGVAIADDELYRVTTTDLVVRHGLLDDVFAKRELAERWLMTPQGGAQPYREGERTTLRDLALAYFKGLKAQHGEGFSPSYMNDVANLLAEPTELAEPRWTVTLDDGNLLLNSYQTQGNQPFSQVRNTRVTTPSSFSVGGKGRLATIYDSKDLAWENRIKAIYKRNTLTKDGQEVTQETDDEIVTTSELRLKLFKLPLWDPTVAFVPFINSNYTTEFNPDEAKGLIKPRRQELNAVSGLVLNPGFGLKEIRAGAVLKNDIANPGYLEPGVMAQASFEKKLEPLFPATFKTGVDVTHYFSTPTDTPDRLGLLADFTAGLTIPLWDRFNFSISADYFVFQGKVPQTSTIGTSFDFKVGLGYAIAFKPFYGVWF